MPPVRSRRERITAGIEIVAEIEPIKIEFFVFVVLFFILFTSFLCVCSSLRVLVSCWIVQT